MATRKLSGIGIEMPDDFAIDPYEAVRLRVSKLQNVADSIRAEYSGAWNGVAIRFLSCAEHDEAFAELMRQHGSSPDSRERYQQERELFGFFVTGLSAFESVLYGLHAIAAMLRPSAFPMDNESERIGITPGRVLVRLEAMFAEEQITKVLSRVSREPQLTEWRKIRNVLAHRAHPGRIVSVGRPEGDHTRWSLEEIVIDVETTSKWRRWLARTLGDLLAAIDAFTSRRIAADVE